MKKTSVIVDEMNEMLVITKAFYKKACVFGSAEYYELRKAREETGYEISFKFADKTTYHGLNFKRMEAYIQTQPNAEANLIEFKAVKKIAEAKGAKYPLTKEWFFKTFPNYKADEVKKDERDNLIASLTKAAEEQKAVNPTDNLANLAKAA